MKNNLYISLFVFTIFFSCNRDKKSNYSHSEYFDSVFNKANNIKEVKDRQTITFIDSAFHAFHAPGIKDIYRKYDFEYHYFMARQSGFYQLYIDSMLWAIRDHENDPDFAQEYANALLKKGDYLISKKDFDGAFYYNYKAREVIEKTKDYCLLSTYTFMISGISYREKKYLEAVKYNLQGIKELNACKDEYSTFQTVQAKLDDIGLAYYHSKMPDSALYYYNADIKYLDEGNTKFAKVDNNSLFVKIAKGVVYDNMGDIYLGKGDSVKAEACYLQDSNRNPGFDPGAGRCTDLKLVNLYLNQNRLSEANTILQQLQYSLDTNPDGDNRLKWYRMKLLYLDKTGKSKEALSLIKPYLQLRDSIDRISPTPLMDMKQEYEHVKDQYNIALMSKQNKMKTNYLTLVLCFSILDIIVALLLFFNWKRSNKLNDKVTNQNKELQLTLSSLTESHKENTRLMQIVAHDLRNPISSMISITSLILDNDNLPEDDREMMELMQTSSRNAIEMISDLLNINTTAEGMKKEPEEIRLLLRYCVDLLQFKASEKKQHITLISEDATLLINREKIWRVMSNLIVNAMKFSGEGSIINVTGVRDQNSYKITITDHGIGIPDKLKYEIFEMFSEAQRPGTAGEKSYGMGMAISKQIVEAHGGKIWFESKVGVGTSFFVTIPM